MSRETRAYHAPCIFVNHGGGPNPILGEKNNLEIADSLRDISKYVDFDRVDAVIVVTAHREEDIVTISSGDRHGLVYDYNNFPKESYSLKHAAPGAPLLARNVHAAFQRAGISSTLDETRGWDHGVFVPMILADPNARVPILQVSILKEQNAARHFEIGRVLHEFRAQNVAIVGSGMTYHNMAEFDRAKVENNGVIVNENFHKYLTDVCTGDEKARKRILTWEQEEEALEAHPVNEADHFMPLVVCLGASGSDPCEVVFDSVYTKKFRLGGYVWSR
ncbi:hypothetical protein MSG28_014594 [Choristoneura fumiferana]|uniref:Uncharacterized protein n=1 Tax=Choristoneura fumiferana TaxID=7141 RepID=A0ACC0JS87_CHOFU|nr:hypothetical protein MSG28_014594 [Choristoneura fumiferana]